MKFFLFFFSVIFLFSRSSFATETGCSKNYSYLVFAEKSGEILSEIRSDEIYYPASLVKLMTLYLTFEALEKHQLTLGKILTISARGEEISKINKVNTMNLREGDRILLGEAIYGVVVKSFNEAAVTLAEAVAGNEWEFVRRMNEKAQTLGMINSSFHNASGLHEEGQYTTSYDLARLVKAIKKDFPQFYHLFAMREFIYRGKKYQTHNHVLVDYKGAEGMKTGFTNASGFNLITSAKKKNARIVSVLLGCASYQRRDQFTKELLNDAFRKVAASKKSGAEVKLQKGFDYAAKEIKDDYEEEMHFGMRMDGE